MRVFKPCSFWSLGIFACHLLSNPPCTEDIPAPSREIPLTLSPLPEPGALTWLHTASWYRAVLTVDAHLVQLFFGLGLLLRLHKGAFSSRRAGKKRLANRPSARVEIGSRSMASDQGHLHYCTRIAASGVRQTLQVCHGLAFSCVFTTYISYVFWVLWLQRAPSAFNGAGGGTT